MHHLIGKNQQEYKMETENSMETIIKGSDEVNLFQMDGPKKHSPTKIVGQDIVQGKTKLHKE